MALSATRLRDALVTRYNVLTTGGAQPTMSAALLALAEEVITEITANAAVSATVTVTSVSGVTTGAGVSGAGTGTATGTVA